MNNFGRETIIIVLLSVFLIMAGFMVFSKVQDINELNDTINETNHGGKIVINSGYNIDSMDEVYYFKDTEYNNAVSKKNKPIKLVIYKITSSERLSVEKTEYWTYKRFNMFKQELDELPKRKRSNACIECIIVKDYKTAYYTEANDVKEIVLKYIEN